MLDSQIQAFLDPARRLVEEQLATSSFSQDRLNDIAKFLTAHLACVITPSTLRERVGRDYEFERTGMFGEGLASTVYGQQVLLLDTSGILQSSGKKQKLTFKVIGPPED